MPVANVTGVILAGGRSSRFGANKAFASFQGVAMIERAVRVMRALFADLLIVTNTPEVYASLPCPVVQDIEPYRGPLGALFTALRRTSNDRIFAVACDMPLLDPAIIRHVLEATGEADVGIPIHHGVAEYLMALYSRRLLPEMRHALQDERLSMREFCGRIANVAWIPIAGEGCANINTREELRRWEGHAD